MAAAERYRRAVIEDEWQASGNRRPAASAEAALGEMWRSVVELNRAGVPPAAATHLFAVLDDVAL